MNLEELNLFELDNQEIQEIEGGGIRAEIAFVICDMTFGVIPGAFMRLGYALG
ncbi:class IIb bacteriocin, lactobin A/cerein 7B family [Flavobacterium endoglycinae]|uniref:Class IIb bacteriocin, lactobin A/cerein 7B family n=1 Tax=Flavobacterium endoglycinae TaxID=2816357 RepID=A0ABX7QKM1_9FLAO|nr:class IIb bacteriocin, lactobin A/cerein 7B family [Flavobacterium endoglycinae]QSW91184.1 class IIb bacteriocin, lactobin A/cerein 7B family [Flavobacterium endoglycinae]